MPENADGEISREIVQKVDQEANRFQIALIKKLGDEVGKIIENQKTNRLSFQTRIAKDSGNLKVNKDLAEEKPRKNPTSKKEIKKQLSIDKKEARRRQLIEAKESRIAQRGENKKKKELVRLNNQEVKAEMEKRKIALCGNLVLSESFGFKKIKLYENGYASVSFGKENFPGKLLNVVVRSTLQQKTGIGRGVGAALTMGNNLIYSNSTRGNLYLSISTTTGAYSMSGGGTKLEFQAAMRIESVGRGLIAQRQEREMKLAASSSINSTPTSPIINQSITNELEKLAHLREKNAITEDEYKVAKSRILNS